MKVKYKPNKNKKTKKTFKLAFGDRNAWKNSSSAYNGNTKLQMDYYGQCINDESVKLGTMQEANVYYIQYMGLALAATILINSIKAGDAKKVHNAVWGSKGLDPSDKNGYWAYKVTEEKQLNGAYAYSIGTDKVVKLSI